MPGSWKHPLQIQACIPAPLRELVPGALLGLRLSEIATSRRRPNPYMKIVLHSPTIESAGQRSCMTPQSPCIGIQMSVRLVSQDTGAHLELGSGDTFSLGRKASLGISAKNVSRDHCTVTTGVGSGHLVRPVVSANKKVYILRHGEAATLHAGELSEVLDFLAVMDLCMKTDLCKKSASEVNRMPFLMQLLHGDTLYLTQEGSQFKHGFFVDIPGSRLRDQEVVACPPCPCPDHF